MYFHIPKKKETKMEDVKAEKDIFFRYDENTKELRIWLPKRGQVKIRRDEDSQISTTNLIQMKNGNQIQIP